MPRKPRVSIDAVVTFRHQGKPVLVTVQHAQWLGGDKMRYTWKTEDGQTFQTDGVPKDMKVLADPGRRGIRQAMRHPGAEKMTLRKRMIRLAYQNPWIRPHLLPILQKLAAAIEVVEYKGRKYELVWSGNTRYGNKAKLKFLNGDKEFWVPLEAIQRSPSTPSRSTPSAGKPSAQQLSYAKRLLAKTSISDWRDTDMGQGFPKPSAEELDTWSARDISALIDDLKELWGY